MGWLLFTKKWKLALPLVALIALPSIASRGFGDAVAYILIFLLPCCVPFLLDVRYYRTPAEKAWSRWKQVNGEKQEQRKARARYGDVTPAHVWPEIKAATFVGSSGGRYRTTLKKCTCPDFQKRKVPCKHMYYLADKCDLM